MTDTILITGTNRGIGLELTVQYLQKGNRVFACCREPDKAIDLHELESFYPNKLRIMKCDVSSILDIGQLACDLDNTPIDILIHNAGIYGPTGLRFGAVDREPWLDVLAVNTIAPLLISQVLIKNIEKGRRKKIVALSSKLGSISDNSYGDAYIYRSSKCALNSVMKSMAIDLQKKGIIVAIINPGWVQSGIGGPNAPMAASDAAIGIIKMVEEWTFANSGRFFSIDGEEVPW